MDNLERLKHVVAEFQPDCSVDETEDTIIVSNPNGMHLESPDKSDDNIQWMIDWILPGRMPGQRA